MTQLLVVYWPMLGTGIGWPWDSCSLEGRTSARVGAPEIEIPPPRKDEPPSVRSKMGKPRVCGGFYSPTGLEP